MISEVVCIKFPAFFPLTSREVMKERNFKGAMRFIKFTEEFTAVKGRTETFMDTYMGAVDTVPFLLKVGLADVDGESIIKSTLEHCHCLVPHYLPCR